MARHMRRAADEHGCTRMSHGCFGSGIRMYLCSSVANTSGDAPGRRRLLRLQRRASPRLDLLSRSRLATNTRHRGRRRRRRWRGGNRCRGWRGRVRRASRRDQRRRHHDGNQGEANHFLVHTFPPRLRDSSTLQHPERAVANANAEWGILVPARWRNIGTAGNPRRSTKNLAFTSAWSKLVR